MDKKEDFKTKSYNSKELAGAYGVNPKTFRKWIKSIPTDLGTRIGNYYNPQQVKIITDHLGKPFFWMGVMWGKMFSSNSSDHNSADHHHGDHSHHGGSHGGYEGGADGGG